MPIGYYGTWIGSSETEKKSNFTALKDFNPEIVYWKAETTFQTPSTMISKVNNPAVVILSEETSAKIK